MKQKKRNVKNKSVNRAPKIIAISLVCLVVLGLAGFLLSKKTQKNYYPLKYQRPIEKYTAEYDLPPALLYAVIHTESGFDPEAESNVGAIGLTQIMPETFQWLQRKLKEEHPEEALYDPEISIKYGAYFYKLLLDKYDGDVKTAAAAYHSGTGQVAKWLSDPENSKNGKTLDKIPGKNANHYANKILKAMEAYETIYEKEIETYGTGKNTN